MMSKQVKQKTSKARLLALLVIVASLIAQAPSPVDALFGVALPSIANPTNDDENLFGLSGLAGLASGTALNMAVGGVLQTGVNLLGGALRESRKPPSNLGRRFIGEVQMEHQVQRAKIFAKEMAKLQEKQSECESNSESACSAASFPMYFPKEGACECVPAISLEMKFQTTLDGKDDMGFNEATFVDALSSALDIGYDRIKVLDTSSERKTAALKLLPDPEQIGEADKVRAFDADSSSLYEPSTISRLRSFLAWQVLDGFGPFSYTVQTPSEMCIEFVQNQSEAQREVEQDACSKDDDGGACSVLWGNVFENGLDVSSSAWDIEVMAKKILDSISDTLPKDSPLPDLLKSKPEVYSKYEESLKKKLQGEKERLLESTLDQSQQHSDDNAMVKQGPTIEVAFEDGTNLRLHTGLVPFSTGACSDCKCSSESGLQQAFISWEAM